MTKLEVLDERGNVLAQSIDGAPIEVAIANKFQLRATYYNDAGVVVSTDTTPMQTLSQALAHVHDVPYDTFLIVDH